jgi:hypothetical protein
MQIGQRVGHNFNGVRAKAKMMGLGDRRRLRGEIGAMPEKERAA